MVPATIGTPQAVAFHHRAARIAAPRKGYWAALAFRQALRLVVGMERIAIPKAAAERAPGMAAWRNGCEQQ